MTITITTLMKNNMYISAEEEESLFEDIKDFISKKGYFCKIKFIGRGINK